jgi:Flp pilus assembly protein TadG
MTKLTASIRQLFAKTVRDRKGAISIVTAFTFTAVLGFAGLGTEASYWYVKKRSLQGATDSAAFAAAAALMSGETFTTSTTGTPVNTAKAISAQYGFVDGTNGVTVTVNSPPSTGPNTANNSAVEVVISQPQPRLFSSLFIPTDPNLDSRAVAAKITSGGGCSGGSCGCVLALDKGNVIDVTDSGNAKLNIPGCSMYVNSDDPTNALSMSGTAQINAYSTYIVGNYLVTGGAQLNTEKGPGGTSSTPSSANGAYTGSVAQADPNAGVNVPSFSGCNNTNYSVSSGQTVTISPGVYCGGISVNGNGTVNMQPGTYIMNGGTGANNSGFTINGNGTVNGSGVSIVLTGSGSNYATAQVNGGATLNLNNCSPTPCPAPLNGITLYQDRNAPKVGTGSPATTTNTFNGGSTQNIGGQIYFPNQLVTYTGGATVGGPGAAQCTELISFTIKITGNTNFTNNCTGMGLNQFGASGPVTSSVVLVE